MLQELPDSHTAIQPYSYTAIQPCSHTAIQSYSHTAIKPYSHSYSHSAIQPTATQPYSHTAMKPYSHTATQSIHWIVFAITIEPLSLRNRQIRAGQRNLFPQVTPKPSLPVTELQNS